MPITEEMQAAWKNCRFCSKPKYEIAEIIRDRTRWNELPLGYKCAWKRICQVGFGRFGQTEVWRDLCHERAHFNNSPSISYSSSSSWLESWCDDYRAVVDKSKS